MNSHATGRNCWIEVSGELHPKASSLSEPTKASTGNVVIPADPHLYEYQWTFQYDEVPDSTPPRRELRDRAGEVANRAKDILSGARPEADIEGGTVAWVRLLFAVEHGWRASEIMATVKHLSPVEDEESWRAKLAKDWNTFAPMLGIAGQAAADAAGIPPLGSVAQAMARLRVNSVPQTPDSRWFVRRVHDYLEGREYRGTEWCLPDALLRAVGTRIGGSLLVAFLPYHGEDPPHTGGADGSATLLATVKIAKGVHLSEDSTTLRVEPELGEPVELTAPS